MQSSNNQTSFEQISKLKIEIEKLKSEKLKLEKCYYCCQLGHYKKKCPEANSPIQDDDYQGQVEHMIKVFNSKMRALSAEEYADYLDSLDF